MISRGEDPIAFNVINSYFPVYIYFVLLMFINTYLYLTYFRRLNANNITVVPSKVIENSTALRFL